MTDYVRKILLGYSVFILVVIYFPLALVMILSFNDSQSIGLQVTGFSMRWYFGQTGFQGIGGLFSDSQLLMALQNSFYIASIVSLVTTSVTLSASLSLRYRFVGRDLIFYVILSGLFIPGVLYGLIPSLLAHSCGMDETKHS